MARAPRRRILLVAALVGLLVVGCAVVLLRGRQVPGAAPDGPPASVRVLTRNLYLGADITQPIRAVQGKTDAEALSALGNADAELRTVVGQTDFRTRARLLAAEIVDGRPDLVALQEAALWRHGPLQLDRLGRLDATEVDQDFLALLQGELAARGAAYDVVASQDESDVEAPAFVGLGQDVRLTMRDVVLVRGGSDVQVTGHGSGRYAQRVDVDLGGVPFSFVRGYVWVDVTVSGRPLRFVGTQLESQSTDVALAQARELLAGPAAVDDRPVVVGCDCNLDPDGPGGALLQGAGLADAWTGAGTRSGAGATCCRDERLTGGQLSRRLDLVLTRGTTSQPVTSRRAELVGDEAGDRDPATGLYPSDHAGVLVELLVG